MSLESKGEGNNEMTIATKADGSFEIMLGEEVIGSGNLMLAENDDDFTYLEGIEISEEHRNHGHGTNAISTLGKMYGTIYLTPDSEDSQRLYERLGDTISDNDYNKFGFAIDMGFGVYEI